MEYKTRHELVDVLTMKESECFDDVIPANHVYVEFKDHNSKEVGFYEHIALAGPKPMQFSDSALSQLLGKLQIPVAFWNRCSYLLQRDIFNYFNDKNEKPFLMRYNLAKGEGHVRAVLSEQYSKIDDFPLFKIIFDALSNRTDIGFRPLEHDDNLTRLVIDFKDTTKEHNGVEYTAGLSITNSETGHSSVWIEPIVRTNLYTYVNRKTIKKQGVDCRIVHRGKIDPDRVRKMVEQAKEIAQVGMVQLVESNSHWLTTDDALAASASIDALPNRFQQILEDSLEDQQTINKLELANTILEFAKELPLFQQTRIEQHVGGMVGIFDSYKTRFHDIMENLNEE